MTLWKVTVVARHRARYAKSHHKNEDALVSFLFARTKRAAARWAALETIVVKTRYDSGGDFYWDDERSVEETKEFKVTRRRRKFRGWPAFKERGVWYSRRAIARDEQGVLSAKEARRRNRISRTSRSRRAGRERAEEAIPEVAKLDVFYREFSPYTVRDAFRPAEPPGYAEQEGDEEVIERLHEEYEQLEAGGSPGGGSGA